MRRFVLRGLNIGAICIAVLSAAVVARFVIVVRGKAQLFDVAPWQRILAIGDSNTFCSFVEDEATGFKILARSSAPLNLSFMRLKEMERRGKLEGIRAVVVNLSYPTLKVGKNDEENQEMSFWEFFPLSLRYLEDTPVPLTELASYLLEYVFSSRTPEIAHDMSSPMDASQLSDRPQKWIDEDLRYTFLQMFTRAVAVKGKEDEYVMNRKELLVRYCLKMHRICQARGIEFVVYCPPFPQIARRNVPKWADVMLSDVIGSLESAGVRYIDCRDWFDDVGGLDLYRDTAHLSRRGAKLFTSMFCRRVLQPILE